MIAIAIKMTLVYTILLGSRTKQAEGLKVRIKSKDDFCMVVPKDYMTAIGDSEYDGGETVWCKGTKTSPSAGTFQGDFWKNVAVTNPKNGVVQMTGCINVNSCDRLKPQDSGGQYDSNGGDGGRGNPAGSSCDPYPVYVELIEPSANRACIRNDCRLDLDTAGCPSVVPGNYFDCA